MKRRVFVLLLAVAAIAGTALWAHAAHHTSTSSTTKSTTKHEAPMVDVNSASKEELMKLPAIDEQTADRIIAGRPWKSKSDLEKKQVLTKSSYEKVNKMITVKPPTATASK